MLSGISGPKMENNAMPRAYSPQKPITDSRVRNDVAMEPITIRLAPDQIDVIDKWAFNLRITRSEFLRNYIIQSLNLPINGKCVDDDIFGPNK